jgi:hypothetical protein
MHGSVPGPVPFTDYVSPIDGLMESFQSFGVNYHFAADITQLYTSSSTLAIEFTERRILTAS